MNMEIEKLKYLQFEDKATPLIEAIGDNVTPHNNPDR